MARRCSVCQHPDRASIDAQIAEGGRSNRALSQTFVLSEDAIARHKKNHLPKIAIAAATETRAYDHHRKLAVLEKALLLVFKRNLEAKDDPVVLRTHGSLLKHYAFELQLAEVEQIRKDLAELADLVREREEHR
jgi:hypothetical protein